MGWAAKQHRFSVRNGRSALIAILWRFLTPKVYTMPFQRFFFKNRPFPVTMIAIHGVWHPTLCTPKHCSWCINLVSRPITSHALKYRSTSKVPRMYIGRRFSDVHRSVGEPVALPENYFPVHLSQHSATAKWRAQLAKPVKLAFQPPILGH